MLLVLVLLIPVASLAAVTGSSALSSWSARQEAVRVRNNVDAPSALMAARAVLVDEGLPSVAVANAKDAGVNVPVLSRITGYDFAAAIKRARPNVDSSKVLRAYPTLRADLAKLAQLRGRIDRHAVGYAEVYGFFRAFSADIDAIWKRQLAALRSDVLSSSHGNGALAERISVLPPAFSLLTTTVDRAAALNTLLRMHPSTNAVEQLLAANAAYKADATVVAGRLGPDASRAWRSLVNDTAGLRFDAVATQAAEASLAGRPSPLRGDLPGLSRMFADGQHRFDDLLNVVQAASDDVRNLARHEAASATRNFEIAVAVFLLSVLVALAAAMLLIRSVVRPLRKLSNTARQVAEGDFTPASVPASGPREVAETIAAVDEMTAVLAAVESFTVTLANDPTSASLDRPLPGRTGLALQTTLDRLRESVREAERQRIMLHHVATHDGLTGLLNRTAALESVKRELLRAQRDNSAVMLLFVDLDGLKTINDTHGHKAGDEAIKLAAHGLRQAARSSDVVARLGGDEFLIAGPWDADKGDVEALADRIHRSVGEQILETGKLALPMRCSIGVAVSLPGDDVESLIHNADQALYAAKRRGRNQIAWQQGSPPIPAPRVPLQAGEPAQVGRYSS